MCTNCFSKTHTTSECTRRPAGTETVCGKPATATQHAYYQDGYAKGYADAQPTPSTAAGDVREAVGEIIRDCRCVEPGYNCEETVEVHANDFVNAIAALITEERDAAKHRWATAHCILCPDSDSCKDVAELRQRAEKAETEAATLRMEADIHPAQWKSLYETVKLGAESWKSVADMRKEETESLRTQLAAAEARVRSLDTALRGLVQQGNDCFCYSRFHGSGAERSADDHSDYCVNARTALDAQPTSEKETA